MAEKVFIDGVEYVPKVSVEPITDERLKGALQSLMEIIYFGECSHKHRSWAYDALKALSPNIYELACNDNEKAFNFVMGDDA